jgi:hypothetical protein
VRATRRMSPPLRFAAEDAHARSASHALTHTDAPRPRHRSKALEKVDPKRAEDPAVAATQKRNSASQERSPNSTLVGAPPTSRAVTAVRRGPVAAAAASASASPARPANVPILQPLPGDTGLLDGSPGYRSGDLPSAQSLRPCTPTTPLNGLSAPPPPPAAAAKDAGRRSPTTPSAKTTPQRRRLIPAKAADSPDRRQSPTRVRVKARSPKALAGHGR